MLRKLGIGVMAAAAIVTLSSAPGATAAPAPAPERTAATTLYYDDSQAGEFKGAVAAGAEQWNSTVENVTLVKAPAGTRAEIRIIADNGWPRATLGPVRPGGSATVWFGRQAVDQGYNTTRIAAHELGHSLGLPDVKPGPCSSLMSGSTGGVSCTNATPNAAEQAGVEANYGGGAASRTPMDGRIIVDAP
ncbi:snapalysin family zinc-dependent metalloprotease [Streptomyces sp. WMMC500]|uniref:snapalysin family zinc-dependent metalloprotease n=1 Tax=Streptomyces sp. WMMC500 TaxID=3015154 RepID=UPI00248B4F44|nr:snapalysin family zinc-dependent metalloprotease [Streptomyces sp. WMMC500]WBB60916.1 snapalysin family zinc-dependent metalloprotease [Streptomyces sp. WMMC500]